MVEPACGSHIPKMLLRNLFSDSYCYGLENKGHGNNTSAVHVQFHDVKTKSGNICREFIIGTVN